MKHLYYVRHGLSVMNKQGLLAGSTNTPLAPEGRVQAMEAGKKAKNVGFDLIVSSTLDRARETAEIIAKEIGYETEKIITNEILVERDFGDQEGTPWKLGRDFSDNPTVETKDQILQRAKKAKTWLDSLDSEVILVVSHGAFIRALRSLYTDIEFTDQATTMPNAEITQLL